MKYRVILLLFFSLLVLAAGFGPKSDKSAGDIQYLLSYYNNHIHVKLYYKPVEKDSTKFTYGEPMFGGPPDIIKGITAIKVSNGSNLRFNESSRESGF